MNIGIQTYVLREVDRPFPEILDAVADAGFDGVEYAYRVRDADREAVIDALDRTGLDSLGAHVPIEDLEDDPEGVIEEYDELDCDTLVVPWLDEEYFESEARAEEAAQRLNAVAADLDRTDASLGYHNHVHEFVDLDGETAFDAFVAATDEAVSLEIDIGLAAMGGADPAELIERYADRVELLHVRDADRDAEELVDVGEGDLDIDACVEAARNAGVEWLVYENESTEDPLGVLPDAADAMDIYR